MRYLSKVFFALLIISISVLLFSYYYKTKLPISSEILEDLKNEPVQGSGEDFEVINIDKGNIEYNIEPKHSYQLWGLVVAVNDNEKWYSRFKDMDPLNTKDICVLWGDNVANELYKNYKFSSIEYVCQYQSRGAQIDGEILNGRQLSNNHLLPADNEIYAIIRKAKVGDQIYLEGFLSNYSVTENGRKTINRGTSITRIDTGNGACETIYVTDFKILDIGNEMATKAFVVLAYFTLILLILYIFALIFT
ncbi:hypothetical protein A2215_01310 [Candidatus Berkelbacteria bacterium RIFOXYA2_FULL_43_10]|uniref:Uncharacterized protein n=1 Tax=Candidatus Berkelbacteria bacterium RIFOXYA2_FULL_43_10 TaxID=1797472 RepID=A0A1F5E9G9_9BACT|nr:MAG: hypothetical protein A2215_01310 [Candidatus Berkelbacteria bacterium RIFOXYA2_FULL_43_10]